VLVLHFVIRSEIMLAMECFVISLNLNTSDLEQMHGGIARKIILLILDKLNQLNQHV